MNNSAGMIGEGRKTNINYSELFSFIRGNAVCENPEKRIRELLRFISEKCQVSCALYSAGTNGDYGKSWSFPENIFEHNLSLKPSLFDEEEVLNLPEGMKAGVLSSFFNSDYVNRLKLNRIPLNRGDRGKRRFFYYFRDG